MAGPSIQVRRGADRFLTRTPWLTSRHSFSYGAHYDPDNVGFGALLSSNEDLVRPGTGFDLHPHANTEILTWVLSGSLVHTDSNGEHGVVYPGLAQRLSAGRGVDHAERNDAYRTDGGFRIDPEKVVEPVHFVQMWLRPDEPDQVPSYQQREVDRAELAAGWLPIASGSHPDAAITIGSRGSTLWVGLLASGEHRVLPLAPRVHVFVATGTVEIETLGRLASGDALRVSGDAALRVSATTEAELLVWELER